MSPEFRPISDEVCVPEINISEFVQTEGVDITEEPSGIIVCTLNNKSKQYSYALSASIANARLTELDFRTTTLLNGCVINSRFNFFMDDVTTSMVSVAVHPDAQTTIRLLSSTGVDRGKHQPIGKFIKEDGATFDLHSQNNLLFNGYWYILSDRNGLVQLSLREPRKTTTRVHNLAIAYQVDNSTLRLIRDSLPAAYIEYSLE